MRPLAILPTKPHEYPAVVELDLTVAEEVGAGVLIEAEVAELAEHPLHTQMARAPRRMSKHQFLPPNLAHGIQLLQLLRQMRLLGKLLLSLLKRTLVVGVLPRLRRPLRLRLLLRTSHRASFRTVLRRVGQACLRSPLQHQRQRRHLNQLRSMPLSPTPI